MKRIHLDRLNLNSLKGLDLIPSATHLYLQRNLLTILPWKISLERLIFLSLKSNRFKTVDLTELRGLKLLDLGDNLINDVKSCKFPCLEYLMIDGNPCSLLPGCRIDCLSNCKTLQEIDEVAISVVEKRICGIDIVDEEEGSSSEDADDGFEMDPVIYNSRILQILERSRERQGITQETNAKVKELVKESSIKRKDFIISLKNI
jgi:hypothetical protein